jgi:hypothetical protein
MKMGRSTVELIEELDHNAQGYRVAMLIVGFENTTVFIKSDDPNRLAVLNEAVTNDGEPVGWVRFGYDSAGKGGIEFGLLWEHENDSWAMDYLKTLRGTVEAMLKKSN